MAIEAEADPQTHAGGNGNQNSRDDSTDAILVLLPDGRIEVWGQCCDSNGKAEGDHGNNRRTLRCLRGEKAVDMCRFLRSKHLIVVVTASGHAFQVTYESTNIPLYAYYCLC